MNQVFQVIYIRVFHKILLIKFYLMFFRIMKMKFDCKKIQTGEPIEGDKC